MAVAVGAGFSMAFSEALSDNGKLSGRGNPVTRGFICGLIPFIGAAGQRPSFSAGFLAAAMTVAIIVVIVELFVMAWVRHQYMETPLWKAVSASSIKDWKSGGWFSNYPEIDQKQLFYHLDY